MGSSSQTAPPGELRLAPGGLHGDPPPPFATTGILAFYRSLVRRYYKLFLGMMLLSALYSGITAGRIFIGWALVESIEVNVKKTVDPQELDQNVLPAVEKGLGYVGFPDVGIVERLLDPPFFMTFLGVTLAVFALAAVTMVLAGYFKEYFGAALVVRMVVDIRNALFTHLTYQSVAYFNRQRSGDIISRLTNDLAAVQLSFRFLFQTIVHQPLMVCANLVVAWIASPLLFVCVVPLYVVLVLPILRAGKKVTRHGRGRLEKLGLVTEGIHQLFGGIRIVKAFGMEGYERGAFAEKNRGYIKSTLRMQRAKIKGRSWQELLYNLGTAGVVLLGVWLLTGTEEPVIEIEVFLAFLMAMVQIYNPIKSFSRAWNQVQESKAGVSRILEIFAEKPQLEDRDGAGEFPGVKGHIAFEDVSFGYDSAGGASAAEGGGLPPILSNISFEVRVGEVVAIVGPSGAGKTTLVDLLARFYDPEQGRILIDGEDIREFKRASYLEGIAIVSQDPFLFNKTIGENVAYGRPGATQDEVEEAARVAFAHEFILEQPQGYETVLGERGVKLSGGQRQRLTIARAVLKNAPILILDEATSALDSQSEKEVQGAMENLMRARTTFVIAHRLSTVVGASKILVLEEGRLEEVGRHEELLARKGKYYYLWRSQNPGGGKPGQKRRRRRGPRRPRGSSGRAT